MNQNIALVTGANGFVGNHVCRELVANGYRVRAMHRAESDISTLQGVDVELFEGDIRDEESVRKAVEGVDYVFNIAALFRQAKYPDHVYYEVNVDGVRTVLDAARAAGVKRVIHCSTIGVHSHIPNPPADEDEPYRPGDVYQASKCEGEKLAREYFESGKIDGAIIRPAMIWGPGDKRTFKLFKLIARRRMPIIGSGKTLLHWILVTDLARAFRLAAEVPAASGRIYIIAGDRPIEFKELVGLIADAIGVRPLGLHIPALPLQLLGSFVELACRPFGIEPPIYRRRVDFFTKARAFDPSRAKRELGFEPEHRLEEEIELIANWYRQNGWLD